MNNSLHGLNLKIWWEALSKFEEGLGFKLVLMEQKLVNKKGLSVSAIYLMQYALLLLPLTLFLCCKPRPNIQGKGEAFIQGIWSQDSIANRDKLLTYTMHHFKFTCDSFYVDLTTHSKVNYYTEACYNGGVWKEYAKGVYQVRNDSLFLVGDFTKPNYKQKVSGCYRSGRYMVNFVIKSTTKDQILLQNLVDERECLLNLKQSIICVQKEL